MRMWDFEGYHRQVSSKHAYLILCTVDCERGRAEGGVDFAFYLQTGGTRLLQGKRSYAKVRRARARQAPAPSQNEAEQSYEAQRTTGQERVSGVTLSERREREDREVA